MYGMAWTGREREGHHGPSFLMPTPESLQGETRFYQHPTGRIADRGHAGCRIGISYPAVATGELPENPAENESEKKAPRMSIFARNVVHMDRVVIRDYAWAEIPLDGLTPTAQIAPSAHYNSLHLRHCLCPPILYIFR